MGTKIFLHGLRRSGTTIAFDLFWEDQRFDSHFEPLRENRPTPGGGSGAHSYDFMEKINKYRYLFNEHEGVNIPLDDFNYGAPREPGLELEPDFPEYIKRYLRFILDQSENTVIKCTRFMAKAEALHAIEPNSWFVHVVKDPRLLATSYLFGKHQKNRSKFTSADHFFERTTEKSAWSSYAFSELILQQEEFSGIRDNCTDLMRILLIWGYFTRLTFTEARSIFNEKYHIIRHEDLIYSSQEVINKLYDCLGLSATEQVLNWANKNLQQTPRNYFCYDDKRWNEAIERTGIAELITTLGYE